MGFVSLFCGSSGPQTTIGLTSVGGEVLRNCILITHQIVVCAIDWGKPVFCACIPGAVNITFLG